MPASARRWQGAPPMARASSVQGAGPHGRHGGTKRGEEAVNDDYTKAQTAAQNFMDQADAAAILWDEMHLHGHALYPLLPVPPHPGPRPPRWRWRARRRWERATSTRVHAKAWNSARSMAQRSRFRTASVRDGFPWTRDAWEQCPAGVRMKIEHQCDEITHKPTERRRVTPGRSHHQPG